MNNAASARTDNFWDVGYFLPQPTQDTDLLKQLGFLPGLKEFLMLRQVHALEHATVWLLSESEGGSASPTPTKAHSTDNETLGGLSTDQGFYLYGSVNRRDLQRAVNSALQRLKGGEWDLAVHPRCGTNLSVTMFLTTVMAVGAHLLLPRGPLEQLLGLGLAAAAAAQLAPDLGSSAQKYLTTSIPFNLKVQEIAKTPDLWGRSAYFVRVQWRDLSY